MFATTHVLFYIPNLIGYFRLCLILLSWYHFDNPLYFLPLYCIQALLDAVDGWAARQFEQVSKYGAWLDVVIDNIGRGMIWTRVSSIGYFISCIEWMTFLALNSHGSDWKLKLSTSKDLIVQNIMKNGFRTPFGFLAIVLGIHCLPIVLYALNAHISFGLLSTLLHIITYTCITGRLFSLYCEVYVISLYVRENLLK